jgi:hypothetical protein
MDEDLFAETPVENRNGLIAAAMVTHADDCGRCAGLRDGRAACRRAPFR